MTHEESLRLCAVIGKIIAEKAPRIRYTAGELNAFYAAYTVEELNEMHALGLLADDRARFYVLQHFLAACSLDDADGDFLLPLFRQARALDAAWFRENPYIRTVRCPDARLGDITLTTASYRRGELLAYDMPDFSARIVTPKLGFFDRTVTFPAIYEGETPWMSVCPSEIFSMEEPIAAAHGRTLVLGLGLGYYPFMIGEKADVPAITIVEKNPAVLSLFRRHLLPQFPCREKITLIEADAFAHLDTVAPGDYDFCFCDIWEGAVDGAPLYQRLRTHAARLPGTAFSYWIEDAIRAYLSD